MDARTEQIVALIRTEFDRFERMQLGASKELHSIAQQAIRDLLVGFAVIQALSALVIVIVIRMLT